MPEDSPFVFDEDVVHRQPGSRVVKTRRVPVGDWANDVSSVGAGESTELEVDFGFESAQDGILLTSEVDTPIRAECVRCLEPLDWDETVEIEEFYSYDPQEPPSGGDSGTDSVPSVQHGRIDTEPAFRDAMLLALPLRPLCRDDCPGLCAQCGVRLADHPGHVHEQLDQRWAGLADIPLNGPKESGPNGSTEA